MMTVTEEEVKARVILPWLASRGLRPEELSLESQFAIRVGTQTLQIGSSRPLDRVVHPRLDILVRRGQRNLLVIETKADEKPLTNADAEQAISYARLVHPIAPFALVTNGLDFRLYDTVTRESVGEDSVALDRDWRVALPDSSRLEALRLFLGLSPHNLLQFCKAEFAAETEPLRGEPHDLGAVYIKAVHVCREEVLTLIDSFLSSSKPCLAVVGGSGIGKTSTSVDIGEYLLSRAVPTLLLRGVALEGSLCDAVDREVEWAFGSEERGLAGLARASREAGQPLVVILDGLEDWGYASRVQELAWLAGRTDPNSVRFVVNCRESHWNKFLMHLGARTGLHQHVFGSTQEQPYSVALGPLTSRQFFRAVDRYRDAFGVFGGIDEEALSEARQNPFLLRLLFQVTAQERLKRVTMRSAGFFERYLDLVVAKTRHPEAATNVLERLAGLMADTGQEWLEEPGTQAQLGLGFDDTVLTELITVRALVRTGPTAPRRLGFSFPQLRSYLLAFRVKRWQTVHTNPPTHDLTVGDNGVTQDALSLFYTLASPDKRETMDQDLRRRAEDYLKTYISVLDSYFPALRNRFRPGTNGPIGFIAEFHVAEHALGGYGFRPIGPHDEEVLFVAVDHPRHGRHRFSQAFHNGADTLHWCSSANGFRELNVTREVLVNEVSPQLQELVRKGRLNESSAPICSEEVLASLKDSVLSYGRLRAPLAAGEEPLYPLAVADVLLAIRRIQLYAHFEEEVVRRRRAAGQIAETWHGDQVSYSPTFAPDDLVEIERRVEEAIAEKSPIDFRVTLVNLEPIRRRLTHLAEDLGEAFLIPEASYPPVTHAHGHDNPSVNEQPALCRRVHDVLSHALDEYRALVEVNFPTLKEQFNLYSQMPVRLVTAIEWAGSLVGSEVHVYFCPSDCGRNSVTTVGFAQECWSPDGHEWSIQTSVGSFRCFGHEVYTLHEIVVRGRCAGLEFEHPSQVLRPLVYGWIQREFNVAARHFLGQFGLKQH